MERLVRIVGGASAWQVIDPSSGRAWSGAVGAEAFVPPAVAFLAVRDAGATAPDGELPATLWDAMARPWRWVEMPRHMRLR